MGGETQLVLDLQFADKGPTSFFSSLTCCKLCKLLNFTQQNQFVEKGTSIQSPLEHSQVEWGEKCEASLEADMETSRGSTCISQTDFQGEEI